MRLGLFLFLTDESAPVTRLARVAESRGVESIWLPEHTHIPASRDTSPPLGQDIPRSYARLLDPLLAIASAAAVTDRILLGTAVTLPASHDPIILAKQIATADLLSDGRLILGIGAGWNREELANHGVSFDTRWRQAREHLAAMQAIWSSEEASFDGDWVHFDRIWSWPKPVQKPHPPILFGTIQPSALVVRSADGWLPLSLAHPGQLRDRVATLHERAEQAGRNPADLDITVLCLERTTPEILCEYAAAGATRLVVRPPTDSLERYEEYLDTYAGLLGATS